VLDKMPIISSETINPTSTPSACSCAAWWALLISAVRKLGISSNA
jgi:hypothetical protein